MKPEKAKVWKGTNWIMTILNRKNPENDNSEKDKSEKGHFRKGQI